MVYVQACSSLQIICRDFKMLIFWIRFKTEIYQPHMHSFLNAFMLECMCADMKLEQCTQ